MAFDPTVPTANADLDATPIRDNFNALKGLIDALPTSSMRFSALTSDPGGSDGDFWFNTDILLLSIRINGTWVGIATGQTGGTPGTYQPSVGYKSVDGRTGGTDTLANAIANGWNVVNGLLCPP